MRRTVRTRTVLRWAALGITGTLAVAGCGNSAPSWWRAGSAAFYGSSRVTISQLTSETANLRAAYQANKSKLGSQLSYGPADIPRETLSWMLRFAIVERLRALEGIHVTGTQQQHQRELLLQELKKSASLSEYAVAYGFPPDMLPEYFRVIQVQSKLEARLNHGKPPISGTQAYQTVIVAINHLQCVAAKSLKISINPQYGAFDYSKFLVVPLTAELPSGQSAATAASLAPHC